MDGGEGRVQEQSTLTFLKGKFSKASGLFPVSLIVSNTEVL